jgi:hypothetical protein
MFYDLPAALGDLPSILSGDAKVAVCMAAPVVQIRAILPLPFWKLRERLYLGMKAHE